MGRKYVSTIRRKIRVIRIITRLIPLFGVRRVRITVDWRRGRIRKFKLEYGRRHLFRRWVDALKW